MADSIYDAAFCDERERNIVVRIFKKRKRFLADKTVAMKYMMSD